MIHRGTVGAMERVVASLLERYQGRLPLWLAPVQVCVLPVAPQQDAEARLLYDELVAAGLRPRLELDGSLGARIRASRERRDCLIAVLGAAEVESGAVQVIDVAADFQGAVGRGALIMRLRRAYADRLRELAWPA
jgi:threonyl-tRNA synthetase